MNEEILQAREEWLPLVRSDHSMSKVPAQTFAQVVDWHHTNRVSQYKLVKMAEAEGLEGAELLPGETALSGFFGSFSPVLLSVLRRRAGKLAEEVLAEADKSPVPWVKAVREELGPQVFRMMRDPEADPKLLLAMIGQLRNLHGDAHEAEKLRLAVRTLEQRQKTDAEKLAHAERKLGLVESKMQAELSLVTDAKSKGGLTPETIAEIEEKLAML